MSDLWSRAASTQAHIGLGRLLARPLPDRWYLALAYRFFFGQWPNYDRPKTLQEHVHVYMMKCRNPLLGISGDKYGSRQFVADRIGEKYLVPLIGVYSNADDVPLETLPRPCVIKPTHASGVVLVLKEDSVIDVKRTKAQLQSWLDRDYSRLNREWYYGVIPRRLIVEEMLHDETGEPPGDYKAYVVGGKVRYWEVNRGRFTRETRNLYTPHWQMLQVTDDRLGHHAVDLRPDRLDEMAQIAERLAHEFEFLRVDFYLLGNKIYIGELTNTPGAGLWRLEPQEFSEQIGAYWPRPPTR